MADGLGITRRQTLWGAAATLCAAGLGRHASGDHAEAGAPLRCLNIVNFLRAEEPRESMDLMLPVREQMALIKAHRLPATWLLQYDAMVEGPFVEFLKAEMPEDHEVGLWFEMNRRLCVDAGLAWRGNPQWEWDYHVPVAYAIGYTPDERRKLADTAITTFKRIFSREAKSVASWNLDAVTIAHLSDRYGIDAFGNCRDQLATDGFTIWGAPIAMYYPSRKNAWSPALKAANQIGTPMFRLLGQDPVYYYDKTLPYPDTMEPAWPSGQSPAFIDAFLEMIAHAPTQALAYAQLGQENSFGWPVMSKAYALQMERLAAMTGKGSLIVETMGATGRRCKRAFQSTPTQAQIMLSDPFGNDPPQRTVWYQSRFFRANLHFQDREFYLRDLHVYSDRFEQPYLVDTVRQHGIEQRLLAVLDGYHWSDDEVHAGRAGIHAKGRFVLIRPNGSESPLVMKGLPTIEESGSTLRTIVPLASGERLEVTFRERHADFRLVGADSASRLGLLFEWSPTRTAFQSVKAETLEYSFRDFAYTVPVLGGATTKLETGVRIVAKGRQGFRLNLAQGRKPLRA